MDVRFADPRRDAHAARGPGAGNARGEDDLQRWQLAAIEASMDGMAIHDAAGRFVWLNEAHAERYGYSKSELLGRSWRTLYDENQLARFDREVMPQFAAEGRWRGEAVGRKKDGSSFPQELSLTALENGGLVCVVRDVSARKRSEEALLHAQKLESLGVLAGGIAHDFNNLLVGVLGNASLARLEAPEDTNLGRTIARIELAGRRAADLTHQMLAYSGRAHVAMERLDVSAAAREIASLTEAAVSKEATLEIALAKGLPLVEADPAQVRQVVMNLVVNASDSLGGKAGRVRLSTSVRAILARPDLGVTRVPDVPAGDYVCIEVADSGVGMDAATRSRMFDPFFTTKMEGRGLGLAVVLGVVRGHSGAIEVESAPGRGSTFRVLLPPAAPGAAALAAGEAERPICRGEGTILVVDDEPAVRRVASRMLKALGYRTVVARDGLEGVEVFRRRSLEFAAVLLDLSMPVMGGEDAFRAMRHVRPGTGIVLMSGFDEDETMIRLRPEGFTGFLQKPFTIEALSERMKDAVGA